MNVFTFHTKIIRKCSTHQNPVVNPHLAHTRSHTHHRINGDSLSLLDQLMRIQLEQTDCKSTGSPRWPLLHGAWNIRVVSWWDVNMWSHPVMQRRVQIQQDTVADGCLPKVSDVCAEYHVNTTMHVFEHRIHHWLQLIIEEKRITISG